MKLPKPDSFGNYWLSERGHAPAILVSLIHRGRYFATTLDGPLFEGIALKTFKAPYEAFKAITETC